MKKSQGLDRPALRLLVASCNTPCASLDAFQPAAVLCPTNGLEDLLQLLVVENAVHVVVFGVFGSAISAPPASALAAQLVGHGNSWR